jgi:DNA-binding MarR family transcriptional regulator
VSARKSEARVRSAGPARRRRAAALDPLQLPVSVWVRLLKAESLITRSLRRQLPDGLTIPQLDVLAQLERHELHGPEAAAGMTPSELTRRLLVTGGNVTVIVESLTRDGLVERRRGQRDRRTVRLLLTERGKAVAAQELPRHRAAVAALLEPLREPDLRRLRVLLGRLGNALERRDP